MSVYDELRKLQNIPDAYDSWKNYRECLTGFIVKNTKVQTTAAICGAGRCNDLDLGMLAEHFSEITLLDADETAMKEAVARYQKNSGNLLEDRGTSRGEHSAEIRMVERDFVGISDEMYRNYSDLVQKELQLHGYETDVEELCDFAMELLEQIYSRAELMAVDLNCREHQMTESGYDYVIAIGVHSQLNNMAAWLWDAFTQAIGKSSNRYYDMVIKETDRVIKKFDDAMVTAAKKAVITGLELETVGKPGSIQGAVQAINDFEQRVRNGELYRVAMEQIIWPLDERSRICQRMQIQMLKR